MSPTLTLDSLMESLDANREDIFEVYVRGDREQRKFLMKHFSPHDISDLVSFYWERHLRSDEIPAPEFITQKDLITLGTGVYTALGIKKSCHYDLLQRTILGYGVFNDEKAEIFIAHSTKRDRKVLCYAFFPEDTKHKERDINNVRFLVNYYWEHYLRSDVKPIPEFITHEDLDILGSKIYNDLDFREGNIHKLLRTLIPGHGIFNDEKIEVYIDHNTRSERPHLGRIFFSPTDDVEDKKRVADNALCLVNYYWEHYLRSDVKPIPELISQRDLDSIGSGIFAPFGIKRRSPQELLGKSIPQYGIFNDEKIEVYINHSTRFDRNSLHAAFFSLRDGSIKDKDRVKSNIARIVNYYWEHYLRSDVKPIPEFITHEDLDILGRGIYKGLNIGFGNLRKLLKETIHDYGKLDSHKALCLIETRREVLAGRNRAKYAGLQSLEDTFFGTDYLDKNANLYFEAYQLYSQKRTSDLTQEDYKFLPPKVRKAFNINRLKTLEHISSAQGSIDKKERESYHKIQVMWDDSLEGRLKELLSRHDDPVTYLQENSQEVWENLGVTSFAAHMKAQELGLIPTTVKFSDHPISRLPVYPLIEFEGYPYREYALQTAKSIELCDEIDVHLFVSPVHRQNFHVNVPIFFRNMLEYSNKEKRILSLVGAYLEDPNVFQKVTKIARHQNTIWEYFLSSLLSPTPLIVPVGIDDHLLTHAYLPTRFSKDKGGVQTAVLNNGRERVYLFRHNNHGIIT